MTSSNPPSGTTTPRFTAQAATAEDLLKSHTVGLVNLADFRKRRADVLELKEKEAQQHQRRSRNGTPGGEDGGGMGDGADTPRSDDGSGGLGVQSTVGGAASVRNKKRKIAKKGLLSFGLDDEDSESGSGVSTPVESSTSAKLAVQARKLTPNPNAVIPPPKAKTKAALAVEAVERDRLRKEFLEVQEKVKNTEIAIPFVFYDGSHIPGGTVKVKKGDHIWLLLERCRKVGAELGVSGTGNAGGGTSSKSKDNSRKQWARVGVDDLMCVRGEVIVPHHYEFYYFIVNKIGDPAREGRLLFDYSSTVAKTKDDAAAPLLRVPGTESLEGQGDDATYTKVVDRRWYQRNKHIYPASTWKEFKVGKEFEEQAKGRRDAQGNAFFFS